MQLEQRGIPTVTLCTRPFLPISQAAASRGGFPGLPLAPVQHPIGDLPSEALKARATAVAEQVALHLVTAPSSAAQTGESRPATLEVPADIWEFNDALMAMGLSDGLPLLPPTPERVAACCARVGLPPEAALGTIAPSGAQARVETLAANAVMAGCLPDHFPVVVAAVKAVLHPKFNLEGIQATTHPATPLVIVHGPVVQALGLNAGANAFGQGNQGNAVIGRALRLILQNLGGASPGETDRATLGAPSKYAFCMAENTAESPWAPFPLRRGLHGSISAVTVVGAEPPHNINDHGSTDARGLLGTIAGTMATLGCNHLYLRGEPLLILSPEHSALLASNGYTCELIQSALFELARVPVDRISEGNLQRFRVVAPAWFDPPPADGLVPIADRPEDFHILVAGGPGKHSVYVPTFGSTLAVTVPIEGE